MVVLENSARRTPNKDEQCQLIIMNVLVKGEVQSYMVFEFSISAFSMMIRL